MSISTIKGVCASLVYIRNEQYSIKLSCITNDFKMMFLDVILQDISKYALVICHALQVYPSV